MGPVSEFPINYLVYKFSVVVCKTVEIPCLPRAGPHVGEQAGRKREGESNGWASEGGEGIWVQLEPVGHASDGLYHEDKTHRCIVWSSGKGGCHSLQLVSPLGSWEKKRISTSFLAMAQRCATRNSPNSHRFTLHHFICQMEHLIHLIPVCIILHSFTPLFTHAEGGTGICSSYLQHPLDLLSDPNSCVPASYPCFAQFWYTKIHSIAPASDTPWSTQFFSLYSDPVPSTPNPTRLVPASIWSLFH